jgi:hypothetical protein
VSVLSTFSNKEIVNIYLKDILSKDLGRNLLELAIDGYVELYMFVFSFLSFVEIESHPTNSPLPNHINKLFMSKLTLT